MPKFNEFLFGGKDKIKKAGTLTPEQEKLMALITEGLEKGTGAFGDIFGQFNENEFNEAVKKPALQEFQDTILPQLNEKFIAGNQVLGSGMRRGQLKASTDLQTKLAQLMYEAKQKKQDQRLAGAQTALGVKGTENIYKQGTKGVVPGFVEGVGQGVGQAAGKAMVG